MRRYFSSNDRPPGRARTAIAPSPGRGPVRTLRCRGFAELVTRAALHAHVLAELGDRRLESILHRRVRIADERLPEQHRFLVELFDAPLDHFFDDRRWLAGLLRLRHEDRRLALEHVSGKLLAPYAAR